MNDSLTFTPSEFRQNPLELIEGPSTYSFDSKGLPIQTQTVHYPSSHPTPTELLSDKVFDHYLQLVITLDFKPIPRKF